MYIAGGGVVDFQSDQLFRIMVANFSHRTNGLLPNHVVPTASMHSENIFESILSHAEVFGLVSDNRDNKFRKRHTIARDIDTINKYIADHGEQNMGEGEKPVTTEDIAIDVLNDKGDEVRVMLKKHDQAWSRKLGANNFTEMCIGLVPDAKPFKPHRFVLNQRTASSSSPKLTSS